MRRVCLYVQVAHAALLVVSSLVQPPLLSHNLAAGAEEAQVIGVAAQLMKSCAPAYPCCSCSNRLPVATTHCNSAESSHAVLKEQTSWL